MFSLIATVSQAVIRLVEGSAISDHVEAGSWNYYSFLNVYRLERSLKITMSSSTGDADVYISLSGELPTVNDFDYFSGGWGEAQDVITINTDDRAYRHCSSADCTIIVGVFGYTSSDYTVVLSSSRTAVTLRLGVPQLGSVLARGTEYYSVPAQTQNLTITVSQFSGHMVVYYSCSVEFPNSTSYSIKQDPTSTPTLSSFPRCANAAFLHIAVYGYTSTTYRYLSCFQFYVIYLILKS